MAGPNQRKMVESLLIYAVSFIRVASRSFQQKNVVGDRWLSIIPTSYAMSYMDVIIWSATYSAFISDGFWGLGLAGFAYGTGGWMGAWAGMWLHNRLFDTHHDTDTD